MKKSAPIFSMSKKYIELFGCFLDAIRQNKYNDMIVARFQKKVIEYGELLENTYGLNNSLIISHLEQLCEYIYMLSDCKYIEDGNNYIYDKVASSIASIMESLTRTIDKEKIYSIKPGYEKKYIDIIIAVAERGGPENIIKMMIESLESEELHFRVVQMVWEGFRWLDDSVEYVPLLEGRKGHNIQEFVDSYAELLKNVRKPDLILTAAWPLLCPVAKAVVRHYKLDTPIISWLHAPVERYRDAGYGNWDDLYEADAHFAISDALLYQYRRVFPGVVSLRVYNPVVFPDIRMRDNIINVKKNLTYNLLFIGRIAPEKNLQMVFEVLKIKEKWTLHIIGDGIAKDDMIAASEKMKIEPRIVWHGWQENPWEYINEKLEQKVDALILSSIYEAFPLSVLEALCRGIPVISSRVDGVEELVKYGENGFIFDINDEKLLLDILDKIEEQEYVVDDLQKCIDVTRPYERNTALKDMYIKLRMFL